MAEKVGYRTAGVLRQAMLHADGWHDVHLHARLRSDGDRPAEPEPGQSRASRGPPSPGGR